MGPMKYLRDGRAPVPKDARTSVTMSRIRAVNTGPERTVRSLLRAAGIGGYRLHYAKVPGRPDIAFVGKRIAVFVHGCFWHGCPWCRPKRPVSHTTFWNAKLDRNKARDGEKSRALRAIGWRVVTVWDCQLRKAPKRQLARVVRALEGR